MYACLYVQKGKACVLFNSDYYKYIKLLYNIHKLNNILCRRMYRLNILN